MADRKRRDARAERFDDTCAFLPGNERKVRHLVGAGTVVHVDVIHAARVQPNQRFARFGLRRRQITQDEDVGAAVAVDRNRFHVAHDRAYQPQVPGAPLNGPTISRVIQPP